MTTASASPNASPLIFYQLIGSTDRSSLDAVSEIGYRAFYDYNSSVSAPLDFEAVDDYRNMLIAFNALPNNYLLVAALQDGDKRTVVGSVNMICCDGIGAIGPISVKPSPHLRGVGHELVKQCIRHAQDKKIPSIRLAQLTPNVRAYSIYHKLGFDPKEFMMEVAGTLDQNGYRAYEEQVPVAASRVIRQLTMDDLAEVDALNIATTGVSRMVSLMAIAPNAVLQPKRGTISKDETAAYVCVERDGGRIVGYISGYDFISHSVAVDEHAMMALYNHSTLRMENLGLQTIVVVIAARYPQLLRNLLILNAKCLRLCTHMVYGEYQEPNNIYCPSLLW